MNAHAGFEGSFLGEAGKISDSTRLECKICWHVYDPSKGCEAWQIAPGTPFTRLPAHWRCPNCDADPAGFMVLEVASIADAVPLVALPDLPASVAPPAAAPAGADPRRLAEARALGERFEAVFRELHRGRMRDVPFLNAALHVQAVGFRPYLDERVGPSTLGILITPWFMNIVLVPDEAPEPAPEIGTKSIVPFPSGTYEFIWSHRPETGPYRACSLFSPPSEMTSQLFAVDVAMAALDGLFDEKNREEGARTGEIRALREEELRRAEAAQQEPGEAKAETAAPEDATTETAPPAAPVAEAVPSRRALFMPRAPRPGPEV